MWLCFCKWAWQSDWLLQKQFFAVMNSFFFLVDRSVQIFQLIWDTCMWSVPEQPIWVQFLVDFDPDWIWPCQLMSLIWHHKLVWIWPQPVAVVNLPLTSLCGEFDHIRWCGESGPPVFMWWIWSCQLVWWFYVCSFCLRETGNLWTSLVGMTVSCREKCLLNKSHRWTHDVVEMEPKPTTCSWEIAASISWMFSEDPAPWIHPWTHRFQTHRFQMKPHISMLHFYLAKRVLSVAHLKGATMLKTCCNCVNNVATVCCKEKELAPRSLLWFRNPFFWSLSWSHLIRDGLVKVANWAAQQFIL